MNFLTKIRNLFLLTIYKLLIKPILFLIDPEKVHDAAIWIGRIFGSNRITRELTGLFFDYQHKSLRQKLLGTTFANPVGLAAGFDKDAHLTQLLPYVGFGFEEIGSVTGEPCAGNPKPRLWRLPKSKGLVINYGLKNDGAEVIAKRLSRKKHIFPIAVSIAKTNCKETCDEKAGISDYKKALTTFQKQNLGDFYIINISCPNAHGGEPFTTPAKLDRLLTALSTKRSQKPILIKISPDLTKPQISKLITIAKKHKISGFVCTNLTKKFQPKQLQDKYPGKGSISGKFIEQTANDIISYLYRKAGQDFVIIGVGGVFTAEDAYKKIRLGASLVQLITGMIFEGPQSISEINRGLVALLKRDGFTKISQAIGADHKSASSKTD